MKFWEDTDQNGITAKCEYSNHEYIITVSKNDIVKTEKFRASYEPIFGMDVIDASMSNSIAEKLALEIEKELKCT